MADKGLCWLGKIFPLAPMSNKTHQISIKTTYDELINPQNFHKWWFWLIDEMSRWCWQSLYQKHNLFWWSDNPSNSCLCWFFECERCHCMFATIFAVLMVKMVRGKHLSLLTDIADGDHHQQQNFSRLLPCDKWWAWLLISTFTTDGFGLWIEAQSGVGKVCTKDITCFGGLITFDEMLIIAWGDV